MTFDYVWFLIELWFWFWFVFQFVIIATVWVISRLIQQSKYAK